MTYDPACFAIRPVVFFAVIVTVTAPLFGQEKTPVPDEAAQAKARELVREVYGDEWTAARTVEQKIVLAKKLLTDADQATDAANRYALLKVARDVSVQAGDAELAFKAIESMGNHYEVDEFRLQGAALSQTAKSAKLQKQLSTIAERASSLIDEAIQRDDFAAAKHLGTLALDAARKSRDHTLSKKIIARNEEVKEIAQAYAKTQDALATLRDNPVDPEANLLVGRYYCFFKVDWDRGLPMLALSSNDQLKKLAVCELADVSSCDEQVALADGWWDLASTSAGVAKGQIQGRAGHWYRMALPGLTGLVKGKVEKRLAMLPEPQSLVVTGARMRLEHLSTLRGQKRPVFGLSFTPDGRLLASSGDDAARLWTLGARISNPKHTILSHPKMAARDFPVSVAFTPDGKILAVSHFDGTIRLWSMNTSQPKIRRVLNQHEKSVPCIAISPDGRFLAGGGRHTGVVIVWDLGKADIPEVARLAHGGNAFFSVTFSPDSTTLAVGVANQLCLWDVTKPPVTRKRVLLDVNDAVRGISFSPDGSKLAFSDFNLVQVVDVEKLSRIGNLVGHDKHVIATHFTPDGKFLLTGGYDRTLRLWDIGSFRQVFVVGDSDGVDESIEISPDGRLVATGGAGNVVQLWRLVR